MAFFRFVLATAFIALGAAVASAGGVVDRIKNEGVIRCGGVSRPGLLGVAPDGHAEGMLLDLCRAVGAAILGPEGRMEFHQYDSDASFDAAREGADELFFLSASEIIEHDLAGKVAPGPTVFFESTAVIVSGASPAQHLGDLAGRPICFSLGANAERHLAAWFAARRVDFVRMGYQEDVELYDAYNVQVCKGLAGEATTLAAVRLGGGRDLQSRVLPEPLAVFPIFAATGTQDAQWLAIVAWAIHSLIGADAPAAEWAAGGLDGLPLKAPELGLADDWQKRVLGAAGTYGEIYARNLGEGSRLKLPHGFNALLREGGLFAGPYMD